MIPVHPAADLFPLVSDAELRELADDIRENGQRHPIVTWNGKLVDGRNRWRACELAEVEPIGEERDFADDADVVRYVISSNLRRRHLSPSQAAMCADEAADLIRDPKHRNSLANLGPARAELSASAQPPDGANLRHREDKSAAETAKLFNVSPRSVESAHEVRSKGAPELVQAVKDGRVAVSTAATLTNVSHAEQADLVARGEKEILAAAKQIRAKKSDKRRQERTAKLAAQSAGNTPLTGALGRFPVIYADPPWCYEHSETESRAIENQYPTMTLDAICALPVGEIATPDAILFLWTTSPKLEEGLRVVNAWGFTYRTCMVWDKVKLGMGYYARQRHELLLIATRGAPPTPAPENRPESVIVIDRSEQHSAKPSRFYGLIERMYPDFKRIELFCRSPRNGWAAWGNEATAT